MNKVIDIDRARELADELLVESLNKPYQTPALHDFLRDMKVSEFQQDCGDILLCYLPISYHKLREMLVEAEDELENYPNEHSALFQRRACQIVEALLGSADKYQQVVS